VFFRFSLNAVGVRLGLVNLNDEIFIERKVVRSVGENSSKLLGLLKMDKEVYFHPAVIPICLPNKENLASLGKNCFDLVELITLCQTLNDNINQKITTCK
jgi:hypothetical protein